MRCGLWLQSHTRYDGGMDQALAQITERVRAAVADQTPLRIRGGGTKDFHGRGLHGDVLDTRPLSGITSYEPSELVITARAGTPLAELEAALAAKGQCLPFEPPHFGPGATVGGMVAAGLSGPARASVGAVRDYVLGVSLINGKAEPLTFGGQVMKNVAGYDVSRLMAGSWGTLGLLTEVSLKVLPVAPAEATLRFECNQADALRKLHAWGGQPLPLNASCWVRDGGVGTLYVRLRGAVAAVQAACKTMGGTLLDNATTAPDWSACRDHTLPWFVQRTQQPDLALWRLSLPATAPVEPRYKWLIDDCSLARFCRIGRPFSKWASSGRVSECPAPPPTDWLQPNSVEAHWHRRNLAAGATRSNWTAIRNFLVTHCGMLLP